MRPCLEGLCLPEGLLFVRELVRSFVVRRLVPPEPLANAANDSWQLELHVCDVIQLGSQRVLQLNTQRLQSMKRLLMRGTQHACISCMLQAILHKMCMLAC